jgi:NADH:ubiquinone oxidoreductase subunit F (NADH-binding)
VSTEAPDRLVVEPSPRPGSARLLAGVDPSGATLTLAAHRATYPAPLAPNSRPRTLLDELDASGLKGRGGAAFSTAQKLRAAVAADGAPVVVVNGTEGEPASAKDRFLLSVSPHLVLDGALLAALAIGATEVRVCIERGAERERLAVQRALDERRGIEALPDIKVLTTPNHYVAGEESALVQWLNGGDAVPTGSRPRPTTRGVAGRPTLVDNAETLAHVAQVNRFGADGFRELGTPEEPGTKLCTVTLPDGSRRVVEAGIGSPVASIVAAAGGSLEGAGGVLVGGYFGAWISAHEAEHTAFSDAGLGHLGAATGCGVVAPLPPGVCGWCETARALWWMSRESAGQCGPCVNGLGAIADLAAQVSAGTAPANAVPWLQRWGDQVDGRGACRLPDGAVRLLRSALRVFGEAVDQHLGLGRCPLGSAGFLPFPDHAGAPWR